MHKSIIEKLNDIEKKENIRILLAVESGSRAWGFASPDSDYDVRFIYVRSKNEYLRLDKMRDVLELPINHGIDVNGWDLRKALQLLYKSNPTLFEWLSSPVVYIETDFCAKFRPITNKYFSAKSSLHHYIGMASRNYRRFVQGNLVQIKKYLYVLRPILACRWIMDKGTPPPMVFSELMENKLEARLKPSVYSLLARKVSSPEVNEIPRINELDDYLDRSIIEIQGQIVKMPEERFDSWEELNRLFLSELLPVMEKPETPFRRPSVPL